MSERLRDLFLSAAALHEKGDLDGAEAIYRSIQEEAPLNADALHMLGIVAYQREEYDRSRKLIQQAIDLNPNKIDYHANLAKAWLALGRHALAAEALKGALRLAPKNAEIALDVARLLWEPREIDAVVEYASLAIALNPSLPFAHVMLGNALGSQGNVDGALAAFREALSLRPRWPMVRSKLLFTMELHETADRNAINAELGEYNRLHASRVKHLIKPHSPRNSSRQKLRIGWVSADFRQHVVGRCMLAVYQAFDRRMFENFCYFTAEEGDEKTQEIRNSVDAWRDISEMDDDQAADVVRSDRLDVLVDLSLHTSGGRLLLFARKPAPVQVTYLAYPGSTGLDAMDYRISNPRLDPPGSDLSIYREKTVMLRGSYLCYQPQTTAIEIQPPPARENGFVTFGCLSASRKIATTALDLWAEILSSVPRSRLILHVASEVFRGGIRQRFSRRGISPDRLEFLPHQNWPQYAQTYNRIDIALDTFPYGAGVTACDSMWMGAPIVTLVGDTALRRMCYSMLFDVRHPEWAAPSPEQYLQTAIALAGDVPKLGAIRATMRSEIESSPLMDAAAVARDLEAVLKIVSATVQ